MAVERIIGIGVSAVARNGQTQQSAETTGAVANKPQDNVFDFGKKNAETAGAVAFGAQDSTAQAGQNFMAMA